MRLHLCLSLSSLHCIHHNWHSSHNAHTCDHPCNNLNDFQLMAFSQPPSDIADALVANNRSPHWMNQYTRYDPKYSRHDQEDLQVVFCQPLKQCLLWRRWTNRMEHAMEDLLSTMKPYIYCTQSNSPCRWENQKSKSCSLGCGVPCMCLLEILEGIDREEHFCDGEEEHEAKEYTVGLLSRCPRCRMLWLLTARPKLGLIEVHGLLNEFSGSSAMSLICRTCWWLMKAVFVFSA